MYGLALLSLAATSLAAAIPGGSEFRPESLPFPDIEAITAVPNNVTYESIGLVRYEPPATAQEKRDSELVRRGCASRSIMTWGDSDNGGKGIFITNGGSDWRGFYFYENNCDSTPYKYVWINKGETQFISLPDGFEGRVQRGVDNTMLNGKSHILGTWFEFSWDSKGAAWADVSLIRGCDGAVLIWDKDNGNLWKGFTQDILEGAPYGAYDLKDDGVWVLAASEKLGDPSNVNTVVRDWYINKVGTDYVYVDDWHGNGAVIESVTGRIATYWPDGRP